MFEWAINFNPSRCVLCANPRLHCLTQHNPFSVASRHLGDTERFANENQWFQQRLCRPPFSVAHVMRTLEQYRNGEPGSANGHDLDPKCHLELKSRKIGRLTGNQPSFICRDLSIVIRYAPERVTVLIKSVMDGFTRLLGNLRPVSAGYLRLQ